MKKFYFLWILAIIYLKFNNQVMGQTPYPTSTKLSDIIGVIHMNGTYRFNPSKDFMKEGVDEIENMGTSVIKLFMGKSTAVSYPSYWGNNWPTFTNLTALAQTSYFQDAFNRPQFKTYVLTAFEMTNPGNVTNFKDGISATEETNLYNEIYNFTTYLCNTYANTGKTFILANWEGDGMLGFVNENPLPSPSVQSTRLAGLTKWFQIRQNAITAARNAANKPGVTVLGAAEFNHVSIRKTYDWPTVIDSVVPKLNMDLYSFSNWKSNTPETVDDFNGTLNYIKAKCPDSYLFGANNIYLGETGTFETYSVIGDIPEHNEYSDRVSRQIMQRNTELALKFGIRYILHWQIYCNGLRQGVVLPPGQNATESQLKGTGIRRADGSYSGIYNYYKAIMSKTIGEYLHAYEAEAQLTAKSTGDTDSDVIYTGASGLYFSKLDANAVGDWIQYTLRVSQTDSCTIKVKYRKGPTYGKFKLTVGSTVLNTVVDCYKTGDNTFAEVTLGKIKFNGSPASYNFKFTVEGKTGAEYDLGIDAIEIIPSTGQFFNVTSFAHNSPLLEKIHTTEDVVFTDFKFYPNPVIHNFSTELNKLYDITMFDLSGKQVMQQYGLIGKQQFDLSNLNKGIYLLKVNSEGKTIVKKLILQ
jgi:hypothetical protein